MPVDKNELRRVMGHFATGVTVVTTVSKAGELHGFTANAVTSLSLIPPQVLVCADKSGDSYFCFEESKVFTINILTAIQEDLSRRFAVSGNGKFDGVSHRLGANGVPILAGVLGYLECKVVAAYEGGDHTIYIGQVEQAEVSEGKPLLFFRGGYRELGD